MVQLCMQGKQGKDGEGGGVHRQVRWGKGQAERAAKEQAE